MSEQKVSYPLYDLENVLPILNQISIFGGLNDQQLFTVFRLLKKVEYAAGDHIFKQGEEASHIYIIRQGEIRIIFEKDGEVFELISFNAGHCFGEISVIGIQPHSASAIAETNVELIVLDRVSLLSLFDTDKEIFGILILNIAREACRLLFKTDEILLHCMTSTHVVGDSSVIPSKEELLARMSIARKKKA